MAVDLKQLGKLLALTRSDQPAEAMRAEEIFTNLFFRWCDEQGLRGDVGFARVGDVSPLNQLFLEMVASITEARVLQLNVFDLCLVGTMPECKAAAWWFENVLPELTTTARRSANAERDAFEAGACRGIHEELQGRRTKPAVKAVPIQAVASLKPVPETPPTEAGPVPEAVEPPKVPTPKEMNAMREGHAFGRKLAVRALAKCPHPL